MAMSAKGTVERSPGSRHDGPGCGTVRAVCRLGRLMVLPLVLCLPVAGVMAGPVGQARLLAAPPLPPVRDPEMAVSDRLAEPVLPESPTQVDIGHNLYYFHCMRCHGDRGQGLTDEFRQVWVEDHQDCWGRGCHTGKSELAAFYIPKSVPPVSGETDALSAFQSAEELFAFLQGTQPPQRPGALSEEEYWALTAFLLAENGRLPEGARLGPGVGGDVILAATVGLLLVLLAIPLMGKRRQEERPAR